MRKALVIFLLTLAVTGVSAQYIYHHPEIFIMPAIAPGINDSGIGDKSVSDNPELYSFYLHSGMSFSSLSGFNTITSWISPKALIPVGSKLMLEVGGTFLSYSYPGTSDGAFNRYTDFIAYARGIYTMNEKLTVWGQYSRSLANKAFFNKDGYESVTMGMEYFITPNLRFGASVTSTNGLNPFYLTNPYPYTYRLPNSWYY